MVKMRGGIAVKKLVIGAVIGVTLATAERAPAADIMPTKPPPAQSAYDWTGFYAGAHFGYAAGSSRWSATATGAAAPALAGSLDLFNGYDMFKGTGSYFAGFQGGYNYLLPSRLLLGVEADISFPNTFGGTAMFASPATGTASYAELVEMSGTLRGRIGYAPNLAHGQATGCSTRPAASPGVTTSSPAPRLPAWPPAARRRPARRKISSWCRASAVQPASASNSG